jgi:DNA processing protein
VTAPRDEERFARTALSCVTDPGDPVLGALLRACSPAEVLAAVCAGRAPESLSGSGTGIADTGVPGSGIPGTGIPPAIRGLPRALDRWAARLGSVPTESRIAAWYRAGIRLVCPGDPEWPTELDVLGDARPVMLWVKGDADLRYACVRSVSVVGARAATSYGSHVCGEMTATLAERGWTIVSGGAYGIDSRAHRAALAARGTTIAVLASGLSYGYPRGHHELFEAIAAGGALVSESPPDRAPSRPGFLIRNRMIAAASRGTVVVEAALRSGALSTARHAAELCRPLMAVPGPVTSELSAGCHEIIRNTGAVLVTDAHEVIEVISPAGEGLAEPKRGPGRPRDGLDAQTTAVLEAIPARGGCGPAQIAVMAGVGLDTAMRCLGELAAAGFIERSASGWRVRRKR